MREETVARTVALPLRSTRSTACGGTSFMMSISPARRAASRALNSGMNRNVTVFSAALPFQ
jgi:hypothetical protein